MLEEDAQDLYEHAPCGYLSTLTDGVIVRANSTLLAWTGYTRPELLGGCRFLDLLTIGGRIFHETHFAPLLRMQGFVREIAFDLRRQDGATMPVLVNAVTRPKSDRVPEIVRITIFDATDRRRYERELLFARQRAEDLARARSALIAMISHDIRTPLNAIRLATDLLERGALTAQQAQAVRVLRSSSQSALTLVNNALDLERVETGRTVLRERPFDLRELAQEVLTGMRLFAERKPDLTLRLTVDERVPAAVIGDRSKLGQVRTNLVSNAVKFTEKGFVTLVVSAREVTADSVELEVVVSDTGIGIPADRLTHIFDEFIQASDEIAERYGGTGLGLAITRKLLQLYGSELTVTSTVGQGTSFAFVLRLARSAEPRA